MHSMHVYAASAYEDPVKPLILAKEWSDYTASKQLARFIWDYSILKNARYDFIIPIPAHWTRVAKRGYNQSLVIAKELSLLSGIPVVEALKKVKRTKAQKGSTALERRRNVCDTFVLAVEPSFIEDRRVLLVDDLMTTGATLFACGKELIRAYPKEIAALVACRVI